jgi:hypothetical protein
MVNARGFRAYTDASYLFSSFCCVELRVQSTVKNRQQQPKFVFLQKKAQIRVLKFQII